MSQPITCFVKFYLAFTGSNQKLPESNFFLKNKHKFGKEFSFMDFMVLKLSHSSGTYTIRYTRVKVNSLHLSYKNPSELCQKNPQKTMQSTANDEATFYATDHNECLKLQHLSSNKQIQTSKKLFSYLSLHPQCL